MRAFIAIQLDPAITAEIERLQQRLRARIPDVVRWTRPKNIHLTLKYLGEIEDTRVGMFEAAIKRACQSTPPLRLCVENIGCFPSIAKPNIIWLGVHGESELLSVLQTRIEFETKALCDIAEDRAFQPHLTLARVRNGKYRQARGIAACLHPFQPAALGQWTARHVDLMRSDLRDQGPMYTSVAGIPLI